MPIPLVLRPLLLAVPLVALLVGCSDNGSPDLDVGEAQAAEPTSGSSQIVLQITNDGDADDALVAAETDAAVGVEIHMTEVDDEGSATMRELEDAELPAGETTAFRPGGLHLMMIGTNEQVEVGGTFEVTLEFERSDPVTVPVEVVEVLDLAEQDNDGSNDEGDGSNDE